MFGGGRRDPKSLSVLWASDDTVARKYAEKQQQDRGNMSRGSKGEL